MKKQSFKYQYTIFILVFIIAGFTFTHKASAVTYEYSCKDGGVIITDTNITPSGIFYASNPTPVTITSTLTSDNCTDRNVYVKARNRDEQSIYIIGKENEVTTLSQKSVIGPNDARDAFVTPKPIGKYIVESTTGVDEAIKMVCNKDAMKNLFNEQNVYHMYDEMMIDTNKVKDTDGKVRLSYSAYEIPDRFSVWSYYGNQLIVASGGATSIPYNPSENKAAGSQGWVGRAKYSAQSYWGPAGDGGTDPNTGQTLLEPYQAGSGSGFSGTLEFDPKKTGDRYYRVRVETFTGPGIPPNKSNDPRSGDSDNWELIAQCPK